MNKQTLKQLVANGATLVDVTFQSSGNVYSYIVLKPDELQPGDYVVVLNGGNRFAVGTVKDIPDYPTFKPGIEYMPIIQKIDPVALNYWRSLL